MNFRPLQMTDAQNFQSTSCSSNINFTSIVTFFVTVSAQKKETMDSDYINSNIISIEMLTCTCVSFIHNYVRTSGDLDTQ